MTWLGYSSWSAGPPPMTRPWNGARGWRAILPVKLILNFKTNSEKKQFLNTIGSCREAAKENDFQHN